MSLDSTRILSSYFQALIRCLTKKTILLNKTNISLSQHNNLEAQELEYIGSKQERRDRKRKHNVMDLFHHHGKKRAKLEGDRSLRKDECGVVSENGHEEMNGKGSQENLTIYSESSTDGHRAFDVTPVKVKNHRKRSKKDVAIKSEVDLEEHETEWINGEPKGIPSVIVDSNDGEF